MATVLVVDDEFGIAELFDAILTQEGHRVLTAVDGRHGLQVMAKEDPDLVFLDYMMPVMDGATMLARIKANPALQGIPVVMMSSIPEATVAQRCTGYRAFLRKPFKLFELLDAVERVLGKSDGRAS